MNKKYNEFPEGVYDTSKIFLQADPVTGALTKVNLPKSGGSSTVTRLKTFTEDELNANPGYNNIAIYNVPANKLVNPGDQIEFLYYGHFMQATEWKDIYWLIGNTGIGFGNFTNESHWYIKIKITKTAGTATKYYSETTFNNLVFNIYNSFLADLDYTQVLSSRLKVNGEAINNIKFRGGEVNFYKTEVSSPDETSVSLSGTPFASSSYIGYEAVRAFDNDETTEWVANATAPAFLGLDLGTTKNITKVKIYTRSGQEDRQINAIIQGSNTSETAGFTDLFTITTQPVGNIYTEYTVIGSYRWVRVYSQMQAWFSIGEMQVWGY
jgi:hypothetical protein